MLKLEKHSSSKLRKVLSSFLAIQILVALFSFNLVRPVQQAKAEVIERSSILEVEVDPSNNNLWVFWRAANESDYTVSNFDPEGKLLSQRQLSRRGWLQERATKLGIDFTSPDEPLIYYYTEVLPLPGKVTPPKVEPIDQAIYELNLKTGQSRKLVDKTNLQDCTSTGMYSPISRKIFLNCTTTNINIWQPRLIVIDAVEGKIVKTFDEHIIPLKTRPNLAKIYATRTRAENREVYDIVRFDAASGEIVNEPPLMQNVASVMDKLIAFQVNSQNGKIYVQTQCCGNDMSDFNYYVFDKEHHKLSQTRVQGFVASSRINEAANQLYAYENAAEQGRRIRQVAYNLDNPQTPALARYDWSLAVVDGRGFIYGRLQASYSAPTLKATDGLSLVVINPYTFSVARFITLQQPGDYYQSKASRLAAPPTGFSGLFFKETGHTLDGKFREYWEKNGGLARFGYPITEPFEEFSIELGKALTVQYFERNRLELHPENAGTQYEVLLGMLGREFSAIIGPRPQGAISSGETLEVPDGLFFKETGHSVTAKFYAYWKNNGGLAQHGLPLTEPTEEINPIDGKKYTVQYFERSRLELHPENAGTQYEVLIGHFGVQYLKAMGWII